MKKLLFIDPQSYSNLALYDYNLLRNFSIDVMFCGNKLYDAPRIEHVDYRLIFCYSRKKNIIVKLCSYLISVIKVLIIAYKYKPDIIHIQWWRVWYIDYLMLYILKRKFKNVVFTAHNLTPHNEFVKYKEKCTKYYKLVSKIIVHSQRSKEELAYDFGIDEHKVFVIPHGILQFKVDDYKVASLMEQYKNRFGLKGKIVFSSLGVQSYYKGTDLVLEVFKKSPFLRQNNNVQLFIIGKGGIVDEQSLQGCINIYCKNSFVSNEEFLAYLRLTDVLLMPYREISQSGVLFTAIDNQVPFVVTDEGGLTEPLEFGEIGWVLKETSVKELQKLLQHLVVHKEEIIAAKNNQSAWNAVKGYYNWSDISVKTLSCYNISVKK